MALLRREPLRALLPLLVLLASVAACRRPPHPLTTPVAKTKPAPPRSRREPELPAFAPRVPAALAIDGQLTEESWRRSLHSGPFTDEASGKLAIPHSELRVADDGTRLWLGLYAADENIQARQRRDVPVEPTDDAFTVVVQKVDGGPAYQLEVTPGGNARESVDGVVQQPLRSACAVELDGTLNVTDDDDEEWVVECTVPLTLPAARVGDTLAVQVRRCDTPKGAQKRCGVWQRRVQIQ